MVGVRVAVRRSARQRRRLDPASLPTAARRSWSDVASRVVRAARRVTIEDVAARAGVHAGTVSRALNRPEQVAPATRDRIEAIVRELDFVPNRAARGLITGRTDNVAVIVPDITNPTFAALVRAAGRAARDADLQLLLVDTGEHAEEEVRAARTLSHEVDGFVVLSPRRLHRELGALGSTPAVFVNRPGAGPAVGGDQDGPRGGRRRSPSRRARSRRAGVPGRTEGFLGGDGASRRGPAHEPGHGRRRSTS